MITGSHNPPEYNGFKISVGKETIHGERIQDIKRLIKEGAKTGADGRGSVEIFDIAASYIEYVSANIEINKTIRPIKIVLDAGNGTAGLVAPRLLRALGAEVICLFCEPDGNFPNHHPDPTVPENLKDLIQTVLREKADLGVAYDGDSDRIGVVDEKGAIIWGDQLMVIYSRDILERKPGSTIVGEVKCSQAMYDEIGRLGGRAVMWKTGHSLIKSKMKELNAALAGEMSGHIFFADRYFGFDDAVYATARLVEILSKKVSIDPLFKFSTLLSDVPKTFSTPEIRVDCPDAEKFEMVSALARALKSYSGSPEIKDVITIDGLRVVFEGGWALVRASNTQPALVIRAEANSANLLETIKAIMREKLRGVGPDLSIPF